MKDATIAKHYEGAEAAITTALWHIKQLEHCSQDEVFETAIRQVRWTICCADTVMQLICGSFVHDIDFDPDEEDEDDDDDDEDEDDEDDEAV